VLASSALRDLCTGAIDRLDLLDRVGKGEPIGLEGVREDDLASRVDVALRHLLDELGVAEIPEFGSCDRSLTLLEELRSPATICEHRTPGEQFVDQRVGHDAPTSSRASRTAALALSAYPSPPNSFAVFSFIGAPPSST